MLHSVEMGWFNCIIYIMQKRGMRIKPLVPTHSPVIPRVSSRNFPSKIKSGLGKKCKNKNVFRFYWGSNPGLRYFYLIKNHRANHYTIEPMIGQFWHYLPYPALYQIFPHKIPLVNQPTLPTYSILFDETKVLTCMAYICRIHDYKLRPTQSPMISGKKVYRKSRGSQILSV